MLNTSESKSSKCLLRERTIRHNKVRLLMVILFVDNFGRCSALPGQNC